MTHIKPEHKRMIELGSNISFSLREIGELVAAEFGRSKPFTYQFVRQVFEERKPELIKKRKELKWIRKTKRYFDGEIELTPLERERLGIGKRPTIQPAKEIARQRALKLSELWNDTSISTDKIAEDFGVKKSSLYVTVARFKAKNPDILFINRRLP